MQSHGEGLQDKCKKNVADAIFKVNADWELTSFNHASEDLFGFKAKDIIGKNYQDVFGKDKRFHELITALYHALAFGNVVTEFSLVIIESAFSKRQTGLLATAVPMPGSDEQFIGVVVVLKESKSSMSNRMILDSVADGVFTVDRNWKITSFNHAAEQITGWKKEDAIGKLCGDVFHSSICGKSCAIAQSLNMGKAIANRSITITDLHGGKVPVSIVSNYI